MNKYVVICHIDYEEYETCFVKGSSAENAALQAYRFLSTAEGGYENSWEFSEGSPVLKRTSEIRYDEFCVGTARMFFRVIPSESIEWYE